MPVWTTGPTKYWPIAAKIQLSGPAIRNTDDEIGEDRRRDRRGRRRNKADRRRDRRGKRDIWQTGAEIGGKKAMKMRSEMENTLRDERNQDGACCIRSLLQEKPIKPSRPKSALAQL